MIIILNSENSYPELLKKLDQKNKRIIELEKKLEAKEEKFRLLSDQNLMGIHIITDGLVKYINEASADILGYEIDEILNWKPNEFAKVLHPDDLPMVMEQVEKKQSGDKDIIINYVWRCITKSGAIKWIESYSKSINFEGKIADFVMMIDITEKRNTEKALKEKSQQMEAILDGTSTCIYLKHVKGKYMFINKQFEKLFHISREEIIGKTDYDIFPRENADLFRKNDQIIIQTEVTNEMEELVPQDDGIHTYISIKYPLYNIEGDIYGICGISTDITERKKIEEKLRENEEKFTQLFKLSPSLFGISRLSDGTYLEINDSFSSVLGFSREEVIGIPSSKLRILRGDERLKMINELNKEGKLRNYEIKMFNKDGKELTGLFSAEIIEFNREKCLLASVNDITERKKTKEALIQSEEKFSKAFQSSPTLYGLSDFETGEYYEVNEAFCNNLEYSREEVIGKKSIDLKILTSEDRIRMRDSMVAIGGLRNFETPYYTKSGKKLRGLFSAEIMEIENKKLILASVYDITERIKMEEKLKESEERFRKISEQALVGITIMQDGRIVYINDTACIINGYSKEEMLSWSVEEFSNTIHPEDKQMMINEEINQRKIEPNGGNKNLTFRLITKTDEIRWIELNSKTIILNGKRASLNLTRDISENIKANEIIKESEIALKKLNEELEQRVKERTIRLETINKELSSFSYSVSHDLRAPLRAISGFSQAIVEDYSKLLDDEGKHYLNRIRAGCLKMEGLINDLLNLSRLSQYKMKCEDFDLSSLVRTLANNLNEQMNYDNSRKVIFNIKDNIDINGDYQLIKILIQNLLDNAFKFTKNKKEAIIEFNIIEQEGKIVYYIKDNGAGFDMKRIDKLFGPFQRLHTSEEFKGIGIGLATVNRVINRHGGKVWAEGILNEGATIYFTLN